jgi:hypothetical protein
VEEKLMMAILHGTPAPSPLYSTLESLKSNLDLSKFICVEGGHRKVACEELEYVLLAFLHNPKLYFLLF